MIHRKTCKKIRHRVATTAKTLDQGHEMAVIVRPAESLPAPWRGKPSPLGQTRQAPVGHLKLRKRMPANHPRADLSAGYQVSDFDHWVRKGSHERWFPPPRPTSRCPFSFSRLRRARRSGREAPIAEIQFEALPENPHLTPRRSPECGLRGGSRLAAACRRRRRLC